MGFQQKVGCDCIRLRPRFEPGRVNQNFHAREMMINIVYKSETSWRAVVIDIGNYCVKVATAFEHVHRFDRIIAFDDLISFIEQFVRAKQPGYKVAFNQQDQSGA